MTIAVEIRNVSKRYHDVTAIDQVNFQLEAGKIYGLLGRNGAGKTSLMQMITAQLLPTEGEILVFGERPYENQKALNQICFIKEAQRYPDIYRVKDVLEIAGTLFPNWNAAYAKSLAEAYQLPEKRIVKKLSRGMLSSLGIIIGLASRAPLTIFDEPYLGLDAVARTIFYKQLIDDYAEHPRTILLSTHLIDEVSWLLEHVLVIHKGKLLLNEDAESLRGIAFTLTGPAEKLAPLVKNKTILSTNAFGSLQSIAIYGAMTDQEQAQAISSGIEITSLSLQDLIVQLTSSEQWNKEAVLS